MDMMKRVVISMLMLLAVSQVVAGELTRNVNKVKNAYNFWLYTPDKVEADTTGKPVFIFLHGASLCGNNLDKVCRYGTIDAIRRGRNLDAYVIAPQNSGGQWNPRKIMDIVDWVSARHNVDSTRVYVLGMSLGGYGTIDLAATYPNRIAAAIAMCGGGCVKTLENLNELPLWIVHGTADRLVSVRESDKVVAKMKQAGDGAASRLVYDRVVGMNHSMPARMFYMSDTYEWLLSHSLSDKNRPVSTPYKVNNSTLRNAYKGLHYPRRTASKSKKK